MTEVQLASEIERPQLLLIDSGNAGRGPVAKFWR
jgi:hypothetical protein